MKIALLLCVLHLLTVFGGCASLEVDSGWLKQLLSVLDLMQKNMQLDAQRMRQKGKSEVKNAEAELDRIKQKCASKGTNTTFQNGQTSRRLSLSVQVNNGIRHYFERTINPVTKKIEERHYFIDINDPHAEPIC